MLFREIITNHFEDVGEINAQFGLESLYNDTASVASSNHCSLSTLSALLVLLRKNSYCPILNVTRYFMFFT